MRHRRRGRTLGRSPSHQRALLRNLACSLLLSERDAELDDNAPKVKGRIVTTLAKAKEVRPFVERCVTIAKRSLEAQREADSLMPDAERQSDEWRSWRESSGWQEWNQAIAPALAARRRAVKLLGNREAVQILFDEIAPRFEDRPGGYTRVMRMAKPRLGDSGAQAILEFVGVHDRVREQRAETPSFEAGDEDETATDDAVPAADEESTAADEEETAADEEAVAEETGDTGDNGEEEKTDASG